MTPLTPEQQKKIDKLLRKYLQQESDTESDQVKMNAFVDLAFDIRLVQLRVESGTPEAKRVEADVILKLQQFDPDDPALAIVAPIFRRLGIGRAQKAADYLEKAIDHRQKVLDEAHSARQSENARAPRPPHILNEIIEKIAGRDPDITYTELLNQLESMTGQEIIEDIDEPTSTLTEEKERKIYFREKEGFDTKPLKISGLPNRLTKAKKKIRNI